MSYSAVSNINQGSFNNPRQKTWATMQLGPTGWYIAYIGGDFEEAQRVYATLLRGGGLFISIDRLMVVEVVPSDIIMTPTV